MSGYHSSEIRKSGQRGLWGALQNDYTIAW
jgi:hypothetical protein